MLRLLCLDSFQGSFERFSIVVDFIGAFCEKLLVDPEPALGIRWLMELLFPLGDVSLDEFHPNFCIVTNYLWRRFLDFSLDLVLVLAALVEMFDTANQLLRVLD